MKEKIKFPDAYIRGNFSSSYKAVGLPSEDRRAVVEITYRKRKASSGAELGALTLTEVLAKDSEEVTVRINLGQMCECFPCSIPLSFANHLVISLHL